MAVIKLDTEASKEVLKALVAARLKSHGGIAAGLAGSALLKDIPDAVQNWVEIGLIVSVETESALGSALKKKGIIS